MSPLQYMKIFVETSLGRTGWRGISKRDSRKDNFDALVILLAVAIIIFIILNQTGVI